MAFSNKAKTNKIIEFTMDTYFNDKKRKLMITDDLEYYIFQSNVNKNETTVFDP